jgi:DNA oxidative demethylase
VLGVLEALELHTITMHGRTARRTVRHFGLTYGYESWKLEPTDPLPRELWWLQERAAALAGLDPGEFAQILVSRYPPGATIGWHRDAPMFGARVVGVSLGAACRMRFQRGKGDARRVAEVTLEPRSAYVLAGAARFAWRHSIPATEAPALLDHLPDARGVAAARRAVTVSPVRSGWLVASSGRRAGSARPW